VQLFSTHLDSKKTKLAADEMLIIDLLIHISIWRGNNESSFV